MRQIDETAWREWAAAASPELRELFNGSTSEALREVRDGYPMVVVPGSAEYQDLRNACIQRLNRLAQDIQTEFDDPEVPEHSIVPE